MMVLECGDDIIIIDAGLMFPSEDMLGVDLLIPDFSYVLEHRDKVRGIVITHGHEDHIGALPYLLQALNVPVYASKLTAKLIGMEVKQKGAKAKPQINEIKAGQRITLGSLAVEFFPVCHSIPDAMGLIIYTPLGTVVHTGDFKLDHTPVIGEPTDLHSLALLGTRQVLILMSDSTYVELPGYTPSERVVAESLDRIVSDAPGRVIIATFSSLVARIQQVFDTAAKCKRTVLVTGRSMEGIVKVASEEGYLKAPPKLVSGYDEIHNLPHDRVVILTTGTQGEPTSALVRMASKEHPQVRIVPELRKRVRFGRLNFMAEDFGLPEQVDVIFCRNVIIYFDKKTQEKLMVKFCRYLNPGGYLFLGHSESLHGYETPLVQVAPTIYRKQ